MHRDTISHLVMSSRDFLITASVDGHLKFWKKMPGSIEFVKHYRAHLDKITGALRMNPRRLMRRRANLRIGGISGLAVTHDGLWLCSCSVDQSLKVYDVINFDMMNMCPTPPHAARTRWQ